MSLNTPAMWLLYLADSFPFLGYGAIMNVVEHPDGADEDEDDKLGRSENSQGGTIEVPRRIRAKQ